MDFSTFEQERLRRISSMTSNTNEDKLQFFEKLGVKYLKDFIIEISNFAETLETFKYNHPGLTGTQYMAHSYRVGYLLLSHMDEPDIEQIKLALCHNVFEVVGETALLKNFLGEDLSHKVKLLTVEREKQWDWSYKERYYENIAQDTNVSVVKIFDKFDNLFILSENKDIVIKKNYLKEIVDFLFPLVAKFTPNLSGNLLDLVRLNQSLLLNSNKNEVKSGIEP